MSSSFPPVEPPVRVEAEGSILYLDSDGMQVSIEAGADEVLVTLAVPVAALRALRSLLSHPRLAAILDAAEPARPPLA